jgi:predicted phosphatase
VFDLDRTLWDVFDKHGNPIWAKQLVEPFEARNDDAIVDDVGSICRLKPGVKNFLSSLHKEKKKISFLSVGGIKHLPMKYQPSVLALKTFGILKFFNCKRILLYKFDKKSISFPEPRENCIFFDDSDEHLNDVKRELPDVTLVDAKIIENYESILTFSENK